MVCDPDWRLQALWSTAQTQLEGVSILENTVYSKSGAMSSYGCITTFQVHGKASE